MFYDLDKTILILDEDPDKAAKALIRAHVVMYLPMLQHVFKGYHEGHARKSTRAYAWINYMKRSKQNYTWVVKFYSALQHIFKNNISKTGIYFNSPRLKFKEDFLELPKELLNGRPEICLPAPYLDKYLNDRKKFKEFKEAQIDTNRVQYIMMNYSKGYFVNKTPPPWYSKVKGTFEFMNVIDNMVVRIVRNHLGMYRYYCRVGLSDTWDEIKNVPAEMSFVVNALMYTCNGLNKNVVEKRLKDTLYKMDAIMGSSYNRGEIPLEEDYDEDSEELY